MDRKQRKSAAVLLSLGLSLCLMACGAAGNESSTGDVQDTTAGDVMLYSSSQIVIFYASA